jgi:hypothetical protein
VALTLNNLAVLCRSQARYDEASALYARASAVFEGALGREHPHSITCRENRERLVREMRR